jgi:hypothetical protein
MPTSNIQFQTKLVELDLNCIQTHYLDHSKAQKILNEYVYFIKMLISNSPSLLHLKLTFDTFYISEHALFDKEMMKRVKLKTLVIKGMQLYFDEISCFTPNGPGKYLEIIDIKHRAISDFDFDNLPESWHGDNIVRILSKLENLTQLTVNYFWAPSFDDFKPFLQYGFPKLKILCIRRPTWDSMKVYYNDLKKDIECLRNDIVVTNQYY